MRVGLDDVPPICLWAEAVGEWEGVREEDR